MMVEECSVKVGFSLWDLLLLLKPATKDRQGLRPSTEHWGGVSIFMRCVGRCP
jgi:hypothetical protein